MIDKELTGLAEREGLSASSSEKIASCSPLGLRLAYFAQMHP